MVPPSTLIPHTPRREGPRSKRSLLTAFPLSPTYQKLTRSARGCRRFSAGSAGDLQGWRNVYGRANETCAESVGTWGSISGDWGFPSEEITSLHQVHPVNNKRLLRMKSRFWETPDGSAFHPHTSHSPEGGATQRALSADGVSIESNIPEIDELRKGLPPFFGWFCGRPSRLAECLWACE